MKAYAKLSLVAVAVAACFGAGWAANGWRADAEISLLKQEHSEQKARASASALTSYSKMEEKKDEAIKSARARAEASKADAVRAASAADGLRKQIAGVPARIAAASRAAVDEYAATAGELLGDCTEEYQQLADKADGHANDAQMMLEAWPK